jgi:predicted DNA-binding transcriptional regulator AlpA
MRKWLSTIDIARLARRSRAQIYNRAKAGKIPGKRANRGRPFRYIDEPEIRAWCRTERDRVNQLELWFDIIELTVRAVRERDLEKMIRWEVRKQLRESKDPEQLFEKWQRWMVHRRPEDPPPVSLGRASRYIFAEIWKQFTDSEDPVQLLRKWQQALADRHPEDLPAVF